MYDLGAYFKFDLEKSIANPECIFRGDTYRITVLTERVIRLEYNENGIFEDNPTELVWYRNFKKPEFTVEENQKHLKITSKYFELNYLKEKSFIGTKISPSKNLKINLKNTNKYWYYNHPEIRKFEANFYDVSNKKHEKGLYSLDGFASLDDSKSAIILENGSFKKRENDSIDIYVFMYDKDFYFCLNDYFMLTGYPDLIPRYALGNWWDKKDSYNEDEIINLIKKFEDYKIPISVFTLNRWHEDSELEFNKFYKNPKEVISYLNSKNIKFGLSIENQLEFKSNSNTFNKLKDYLVKDSKGNIPFNVFDVKTIDAFLKILIHPLDNLGVSFYSLNDFNKNLDRLKVLKHYLYKDKYKKENKRSLISSQNSLIAPHRYSVLYSGKSDVSWDTLKKIILLNTSAPNIGISFLSHDIGGTTGGIEDNELFIRFVQLGVFSPILRLGSDSGKYYKREPWKWGLKPRTIATDFLNLRYSLIPYIYTESYKYFKYGKPLIEPIYYRYPAIYDNDIYKKQYFFGSTFLVSPIVEKKEYLMNRVIQKFYIPEGTWYGFFTGKKFKGNKKYVSFYRDHEYPVFVKAGAIIPLAINEFNETCVPKKMEIQVFPGANNTYSIYEDDGETNNYLKGEYLITNVEFVYKKNDYKLIILPVSGKAGIIPEKRDYKIRFKNTRIPSNISCYVSNTQVQNICYKEGNDLIIELKDIPTKQQLTILCKGEDIEIEAITIVEDDVVSIISDLPLKTVVKQRIDDIMFSKNLDLKKKRIRIRRLANGKDYIERKYIDLLLKLLEYINEV